MRKVDAKKLNWEKMGLTINFDKPVYDAIIEKSAKIGKKPSFLVNMLAKTFVLSDVKFYAEMERLHHLEMENYRFMKERAQELKDIQNIRVNDL